MDMKQYISTRVDDQIAWYDQKASKCQNAYKWIQSVEVVLAAIIPLLSGYCTWNPYIPLAIGSIGVVITVLESITKLNKYHENWIQYRSTCEMLKYQKNLYETTSFPYNTDLIEPIDSIFVRTIEQIISSENNQWKTINITENHRNVEIKKDHSTAR